MFKIITGKCCVGQIVWDQFNYLRGFFSRQAIYLCQYGKQWHWAFSFEKCLIKTQMFSLHKPVPKLIFSCSFAYQGKGDIFANLGNRDAPFWNVLFPMGIARKGGGKGQSHKNPVSASAMLTGKFLQIRRFLQIGKFLRQIHYCLKNFRILCNT